MASRDVITPAQAMASLRSRLADDPDLINLLRLALQLTTRLGKAGICSSRPVVFAWYLR